MKKYKPMTPEQIAKIKELFAKGVNSYQIAKALKLPPYVTKYHCDRVLLERAKNPMPQPQTPLQERLEEQGELSAKQKNRMLLEFINSYLAVH